MSPSTKTLYLCGVGNGEGIRLALTVKRCAERWQRIVLLDDDPKKHGTRRLGLEVAGPFSRLAEADPAQSEVVNLVTRTTAGRDAARARIGGFGIPFASLAHPGVDLFGTEIGEEVTLYQNASIGAEARVGNSSVVLIGAVVGHGVHIGRCCIVAPNAVVNARVRLGDLVYVGSNASILPDVSIGEGATVAANSVVIGDVPPGATAIGVPASVIFLTVANAGERSGAASSQADSLSSPSGTNATPTPPITGDETSWASQSELERGIVEIAREILAVDDVGVTGNFFDLGGNSLKALQFWKSVQGRIGRELRLLDIYRFPTARALASFLGGGAENGTLMQQAHQRASLRRRSRMALAEKP